MSIRILYTILAVLCFSVFLIGQKSNSTSSGNGNSVLTFTPASKMKKSRQTRFRKQYFGRMNGKDMELTLSEKIHQGTIELTINLIDLKDRQTFKGTKTVPKKVHQLENLVLKNVQGQEKLIESLFLHNDNPNFINLITKDGQVGYFFWGEEPVQNGFYAKPYISLDSFKGIYEGRIDGRPAVLKIENRGEGLQLIIEDRELNQQYWTYLSQLPLGKRFFLTGPLKLKSTTSTSAIVIKKLVLDKDNTQIISGSFAMKEKEVGLFFIRKTREEPTVLPEFPWPPPQPSDFLKLNWDTFKNVKQLGDIDTLITQRLNQAGYQLRPNKYFYTPNGFALVTQIEQVDCKAKPLKDTDRWTNNISEFEKDFNLIDYLRFLSTENPGLYRILAFVITDDLNPLSRIDPSLDEKEAWLVLGSVVLPDSIAHQKLSEKHYGRIYVYEFEKKETSIHAEMVKKGKNDCWQSGEMHLKRTNFFDN